MLGQTATPAAAAKFAPPDWLAPLDVDDHLAAIPPAATVKGMFFSGAVDVVRRQTGKDAGKGRYIPFKDYPLIEHARTLVDCAQAAFPTLPVRQGLRRLGNEAYSIFVASLAGKAIFGIAGRNWEAALALVSRAYAITGPVGRAEVAEIQPMRVVIALRGIWNFADSYHVGVFEAAMQQFGKKGEVWIARHGRADVDLELRVP